MLSCLAVSRIPAIDTQLRIFRAPRENEEDLRPFVDYLVQLRESVKEYLFNELPLENSAKIERDFRATTVCPFCHKKLDDGRIVEYDGLPSEDLLPKVRHHAHVAGDYTTGNGEVRHFEAGQYICTCCTKCKGREGYATSKLGSTSAPVVPSAISNSRSTRRTIVYPYTSTMDRTTTSHSS